MPAELCAGARQIGWSARIPYGNPLRVR